MSAQDDYVRALEKVAAEAQKIDDEILPRLLHGEQPHREWLTGEIRFLFAHLKEALKAKNKAASEVTAR